jgi:hypothetical protein
MCDTEALCVPFFFSLALLVMGTALMAFEASQETPVPDVKHTEFIQRGNDTKCFLRADDKKSPTCRKEKNQVKHTIDELLCFCPVRMSPVGTSHAVEAKVFIGPEAQLDRDTVAWCNEALSGTWPNLISLDPAGSLHWSCNVIIDGDAEPCRSGEAESRARDRKKRHWRCFADIVYNTKKHHDCLVPLVPNQPAPCVHLEDGRVFVGSKTDLLDQLGAHHGQFAESKRITMMIGSCVLGVGAVVLVVVMLLYVVLSRQEKEKKHRRRESAYGDDDMIGWSSKRSARFRSNAAKQARSRPYGKPQFDDVLVDCMDEIELPQRPNPKASERAALLHQ